MKKIRKYLFAVLFFALICCQENSDNNLIPAIAAAGQSNLGTNFKVADSLEQEYKKTYDDVMFLEHDSTRFVPMDWTNNKSYQSPDQNGAYSLQFYLYPSIQKLVNEKLYVVHHGKGNTGLATEWKSDDGELYLELVQKIKTAKHNIPDIDFKFLLWVHGEYDSRVKSYANSYESNLTDFINDFREDTGLKNLPVIIVKLNTETINAPVNPCTYASMIRAAQEAVSNDLSNVYTVESNGADMHTDKIHYTVRGEHTLAERILEVIESKRLN